MGKKIECLEILQVYSIKDGLYLYANCSEKIMLFFLDIAREKWYECFLPENITTQTQVSVECVGNLHCFGYYESKTNLWHFFEIVLISYRLHLKRLNFIEGNLFQFKLYGYYQNAIVFQLVGENIRIFDSESKLLAEFENADMVASYNNCKFDIIQKNSIDKEFVYCGQRKKYFYYYTTVKRKEKCFCYNIETNKNIRIRLKKTNIWFLLMKKKFSFIPKRKSREFQITKSFLLMQ